jgi:hypothetical protein
MTQFVVALTPEQEADAQEFLKPLLADELG